MYIELDDLKNYTLSLNQNCANRIEIIRKEVNTDIGEVENLKNMMEFSHKMFQFLTNYIEFRKLTENEEGSEVS